MARAKGGRGLSSCEGCVRSEGNSLGWYVKNSEEGLLGGVKATDVIEHEQRVESEEFKKAWHEEKLRTWKGKNMYGQYLRDMGMVEKGGSESAN